MSNAAGLKILPYFEIARQYFPIIDPDDDPIILDDTPASSWGLAWCYGLAADGDPRFAVRADIDVDKFPYIGYHESGHAFHYSVARALAAKLGVTYDAAIDVVRVRYWSFRGFPGSWQDAQAQAIANRRWELYPDESIADCFAHALAICRPWFPGYITGEWTANYGLPLDKAAGLAFMRSLQEEVDMFTEEDRRMLQRVYAHAEAYEPLVWTKRLQQWLAKAIRSGLPAADLSGPDVDSGQPFKT